MYRPKSVRFFGPPGGGGGGVGRGVLGWCWGVVGGCWIKSEVYKTKVYTLDELLARILDAAACIKKRDQLRRTTRDLRTRVAKCTEVDGGILEHLLCSVTDLLFLCNTFVI